MKSAYSELPGLDLTSDYGHWEGHASRESIDSALDLVLSTPQDDGDLHAPIWDHEAAEDLVQSIPCAHRHSDPHQARKRPFALLGTRRSHYLSLDSPTAYQQFIQPGVRPEQENRECLHVDGRSDRKSFASEEATANTGTPRSQAILARKPPPMKRASPVKLNAHRAPQSPRKDRNSSLTFFAMWDPEANGMVTFSGSHLLQSQAQPLTMGDSHSPNSPPFRDDDVSCGDLDPDTLKPLPKGNMRKWSYRNFVGAKKAFRKFSVVEDEGFFESPGFSAGRDHPESPLVSRFSTSTTSTSNYVHLDFPLHESARRFAQTALNRHAQAKKKAASMNGLGMSSKGSTPTLNSTVDSASLDLEGPRSSSSLRREGKEKVKSANRWGKWKKTPKMDAEAEDRLYGEYYY